LSLTSDVTDRSYNLIQGSLHSNTNSYSNFLNLFKIETLFFTVTFKCYPLWYFDST